MGAGLIIQNREPDEPKDDENHGLMSAAHDVISAIEAKDHRALACALQAAYDICEATQPGEPLESGEHE